MTEQRELATLRGSNEEIAQATRIRAAACRACACTPIKPACADSMKTIRAAQGRLLRQQSASWWIAHQKDSPDELLMAAMTYEELARFVSASLRA